MRLYKLRSTQFNIFSIIFLSLITSSVYCSESNTYKFSWLDEDKEVFVLQNRKYRKKSRPYIFGGVGTTTSGKFVDSTNFQLKAGYFFKEEWGIELTYSSNSGSENDTAASVRSLPNSIPFRRIVDSYIAGMLVWSPFYGKVNTFNKVLYFDWYLGLGFASLDETNNRNELNSNGTDTTLTAESHTGLTWMTAVKFWINRDWSARLDLTTIHYQAQSALANSTESDKSNYSNYDLTLGIEYNF